MEWEMKKLVTYHNLHGICIEVCQVLRPDVSSVAVDWEIQVPSYMR